MTATVLVVSAVHHVNRVGSVQMQPITSNVAVLQDRPDLNANKVRDINLLSHGLNYMFPKINQKMNLILYIFLLVLGLI